jgi:DnaK suppressor protein
MADDALPDAATARALLARRRDELSDRLADAERRLTEVREARADWTDEEHDPEGFALTFEWQQSEGLRAGLQAELAELERAGARVSGGDYGRCAVCGRPIPIEQLELRPARAACVRCAARRRR